MCRTPVGFLPALSLFLTKGLFKAQFLISYWDPFLDAEIKKIRGSRTRYVSVMLTKLRSVLTALVQEDLNYI